MKNKNVSRVSEVSEVSKVSNTELEENPCSLNSENHSTHNTHFTHLITSKTAAFTLAEGRQACTTTQVATKGGQVHSYTQIAAKEVQNRHETTEPASCNSLVPQCLVLDLLHAHGDSPEERCSCRLVPFAIRTRFAVLLAGVKRVCNAAAFASPFRPLPARAPSVRKSASPLVPFNRAAFTLAETLITLAVIGIVAALTLPGLIQNHNEKAWSTAKNLWEKKLTETVRRMNTDGVMTGHKTTEDFMNSFKQYMKIVKACDNNDLNKCYSAEFVLTGKRDNLEKKYIKDFKTAGDLGISDWNTNTMSFVVSDGTTVIFAYNPNCPYADPIEDTGSQVSCLGMMIDVNGKKSPNQVGKDILLSNATISTCDNPIGDMCWSTDFFPTAINTCSDGTEEDKAYDPTGDSNEYCATNNWAGAKKSCDQKNMSLPTRAQLAQLASNIFVDSSGNPVTIGATEDKLNLKLKDEYQNSPPINIFNGCDYWSSEENNASGAHYRGFFYTTTHGNNNFWFRKRSNGHRAVCIAN